ncbi:MAG: gliding motility-associated C-terminal domain-containing protein [Bacteroidota bacterium]
MSFRSQIVLTVFLVLGLIDLKAQFVSQKGWFEVSVSEGCPAGGCSGNVVSGCAPLTINVAMTALSPFDCFNPPGTSTCDFDYFGDGGTLPTVSVITYDDPGQFRFEILFGMESDEITVNVRPSDPPDFSIFSCAGGEIQVSIEDNQYQNYLVNFGDGSPEVIRPFGSANAQHTYTDNTPRTVSVRGVNDNAADNCAATQKVVTPLASLPASRFDSLVSIDDNSLALYYDLRPNILHRLEIEAGNVSYRDFGPLDADAEADTLQLQQVEDVSYCFRIVSIDPCSGNEIISNEICNTLFEIEFLDGVNELSWQNNGDAPSFSYSRLTTSDNTILTRPNLTGNTFDDTDIDCEQEYCYTLTASYADNSISRSVEVCGTSFNTTPPAAVNNLSVSIQEETGVALEWPVNVNESVSNYSISKGLTASSLTSIINVESSPFVDQDPGSSERSICYQIAPQDECENTNRNGVVACSIFLTGTILADNTVTLNWNAYEGWDQGVTQYRIEKAYLSADAPDASSTTPQFQEVEDNGAEQVIIYRIQAIPSDNTLPPIFSNSLILTKPNNIYFPNAFTPNGDGNNDTFSVNGRFLVSYDLRIFNRWGEEVFNSTNPEIGWNGTREGKPLPLGAYAFKVDMVDQAGQEITEAGTVLLLRN